MSVGSVLATARTTQGRSVTDVSEATRIRPHIIRGIEADEYGPCGGDVYARGHVRALARFLGVDAEPLLAELTATGRARSAPVSLSAADGEGAVRRRRGDPRWIIALAAALVLMAALAAVRLLPAADRPGGTAAGTPSASHRVPAPSPTVSRSPAAGGLAVSLRVTGRRCWISVTGSNGASRLASVLTQGQTVAFRDDSQLSIVIGNPGAVTVSVNGHRVRPAETNGVQRFVLKADSQSALAGGSMQPTPAA